MLKTLVLGLLLLGPTGCDARGVPGLASSARALLDAPPVEPWKPPPPLAMSDVARDAEGEARLRADVEVLASTKFGGRGTGEPGAKLTTAMIAERFASLGLAPRGDSTDDAGAPLAVPSYLFRFAAKANAKVAPPTLTFTSDLPKAPPPVPPGGLQAVDGSGTGVAEGDLVAVGFGVSTAEWDDYGDADVEGKIVVVRRGAPPIPEKTPDDLYELSKFRRKIRAARQHKASGVIVVSSTEEIPGPPIDPEGVDLPAVVLKRSAARLLFGAALVDDADAWKPKAPAPPRPIEHLHGTLSTKIERLGDHANDVAGWLPAYDKSETADEWVVLGAHHDHLGMGGPGSLAPGVKAIHPGADDNGSGTAVLMDVARTLSRLPRRPARNVLFLAFGAEELGLIGSAAWVERPTVPLDRIIAMVNADMVGRLREQKFTIEGTTGQDAWPPLFFDANEGLPLVVNRPTDDKYGARSDHASFAARDIPVAFLFTDVHPDYHRPSDTADKINYVGLEDISTFTSRLVLGIAERGFVRSPKPEPKPKRRANPWP